MRSMQQPSLSRRRFCLCCAAATAVAATGVWPSPRQAFAKARTIVDLVRQEAANAPIVVHKLRGNITLLEGSGGNIAVLCGSDGKLLIDAGITASRGRIKDALAGLDPQPVRHLVNTHWHFDHADGNEWLAGEGAAIVAHVNTRKHLMEAQRVEAWDFDFPPSPPAAIPSETFPGDKTIKLNGTTIDLKHHAAAHTDGDITVAFAEADIIHMGDIYWNGFYPFIDHSTGGSIDGTIRAVEAILAVARDSTIIIPGHGRPVSNAAELRDYRHMLVAIRDRVADLKRQGRSLKEVVTAKPTSAFDAKWGRFVNTPDFFTMLVYQGV